MTGTKVKFNYPNSSYQVNTIEGIIKDKYIGLSTSKNEVASGKGGSFDVRTNFSVDYYLILGTDNKTYSIKCSDIIIIP